MRAFWAIYLTPDLIFILLLFFFGPNFLTEFLLLCLIIFSKLPQILLLKGKPCVSEWITDLEPVAFLHFDFLNSNHFLSSRLLTMSFPCCSMPHLPHFLFSLFLFRATPAAYGSSRARGWTQDPSHICDVHRSSGQLGSLTLRESRDQTCVFLGTNRVLNPLSLDSFWASAPSPLDHHPGSLVSMQGLDADTKSSGSLWKFQSSGIKRAWEIIEGGALRTGRLEGDQKCPPFSCFSLSCTVAVRSRDGAGLTVKGLAPWFPNSDALFFQDKVLTTGRQSDKIRTV